MLKLCVYVLKYYITIKKNEVELYILKGLQDFLCYSKASCRPCIIWSAAAGAAAKSLQSCLALCDPIDGSPPGSPIPRILQARALEWVTISFSNAWKWKWSHSVMSNSLPPHGLQPTRLLHPWDFPGKRTGVGCHRLLLIRSLKTYQYDVCVYIFKRV